MPRYLDRLLKLRQLRIVNALWQHGSLSRASTALGLSQPALTKALQNIEETIGTAIYERHSRGVNATSSGRAVIETSRRILAELARLDEELDRIESSSRGTVAIGALPSAAIGLLPQVLAALQEDGERLHVRIVEGPYEEMAPALLSGEVDLIAGRIYEPPSPDGLTRRQLYEDPAVLLARAGHPIFASTPSIAVISRYELILPPVGRRFGQELGEVILSLPELRPAPVRSTSIGFTREMILATDMITLAPATMMSGDIQRGAIRVVPLKFEVDFRRPSGVTYRSDRSLSPAAERFVASFRRVIAATSNATGAHVPAVEG